MLVRQQAFTAGRFSTAPMNAAAMSPCSSRSRFLLNTVGTHTGSSTDSPTNQQVVIQLLHQLPLRANGMESLQQQGPQQLLRRDRRAAVLRVEPGKLPVERGQSVVGKAADQAKRVVFGDAAIRAHIAEQAVPSLVYAAHSKLPPAVDPRRDRIRYARVGARAFSAAC